MLVLQIPIKNARVAQLVERDLAKVEAAGSSPVSRFYFAKKAPSEVLFLQIEPCRGSKFDNLIQFALYSVIQIFPRTIPVIRHQIYGR